MTDELWLYALIWLSGAFVGFTIAILGKALYDWLHAPLRSHSHHLRHGT